MTSLRENPHIALNNARNLPRGIPHLPSEILEIIRTHRGAENAISAEQIAQEIGWPNGERAVRRVIAALSPDWPEIVCARLRGRGDEGGYFIPQTYEEIEAYWAWLADLAAAAQAKAERFEQACARQGIKLKHT